jgi:hypothetical protein
LTGYTQISSAGRSSQDCETPWALSHLTEQGIQSGDWRLELEYSPGRVLYFHGSQLEAPDFTEPEDKLKFTLRRVCHLLLDHIDDKGLEDVCQSLAEFYVYYKPTEKFYPLLPEAHSRRAKSVTRCVSPGFVIEEE